MIIKFLYNEEYKDLVTITNEESLQSYLEENYFEVTEEFANKIIQKEKNRARIDELKTFLYQTDWKIIVNSELSSQGLEIKYTDIHNERQSWRNEINELEEKIKDEA